MSVSKCFRPHSAWSVLCILVFCFNSIEGTHNCSEKFPDTPGLNCPDQNHGRLIELLNMYLKKSFQHLTVFFMSTCIIGDFKICKQFLISHKEDIFRVDQSRAVISCSKSHRETLIFEICL